MKKESTRLSLVTASELCKFDFAFSCTSETILRCNLILALTIDIHVQICGGAKSPVLIFSQPSPSGERWVRDGEILGDPRGGKHSLLLTHSRDLTQNLSSTHTMLGRSQSLQLKHQVP